MRKHPTKKIEQFRITQGRMASDKSYGANGAFVLYRNGVELHVIVSDEAGWRESDLPDPVWEHVSVSVRSRCPTWEEMDFVKRIFWRGRRDSNTASCTARPAH